MSTEALMGLSESVAVENFRRIDRDDVLLVGFPCSGQILTGNILLNLGFNYVIPGSEELREDGSSVPLESFRGLNGRISGKADMSGVKPRYSRPRFMGTHHPAEYFDSNRVGGIWLIVRDPRDALYSQFRLCLSIYAERSRGSVREMKFADWLKRPLDVFDYSSGGDPVSAWVEYYSGWLEVFDDFETGFMMNFENVKRFPVETIDRGLRVFGRAARIVDIESAVSASSFESMRKHEEGVVNAATGKDFGLRFMRRGAIGEWKEWMTATLREAFEGEELTATARRLGYSLWENEG